MTTCRECSGQVSSEAVKCPHCGARPEQQNLLVSVPLGLLAIAGIVLLVYLIAGKP